MQNLSDKIPQAVFVQYDTENDVILRDETTGMCKLCPRGTPGLLVAQITDTARYDGYASKKQTSTKIVTVSIITFDKVTPMLLSVYWTLTYMNIYYKILYRYTL